MNSKLLNIEGVRERVPVSKVSIWRWQKVGKFPQPVRIGRRILWRAEDIDRFLSADAGVDTPPPVDADQVELGQRSFAHSRLSGEVRN